MKSINLQQEGRTRGLGLGRKYKKPDLIGAADFETTPEGKPYTFQLAILGQEPRLDYLEGNSRIAREIFYGLFEQLPAKGTGFIGFYFFKFDIQALFLDKPEWFSGLANLNPEIHNESGVTFQGCLIWPTVFVIMRKDGKKIVLFDLFRFFEGGLKKVSESLKLPYTKKAVPACIKHHRLPRINEIKEFEEYAIQDAVAALGVTLEVLSLFEKYDVGLKISNAHLAATIFKKHFTDGKGLDEPDFVMQKAALKAYHGGRNSLTVSEVPFFQENCRYYDVSSMYPFCGTKLPAFFGGKWVWWYWSSIKQPIFTVYGIYKIDFSLKDSKYKLLMDEDGRYLEPGNYKDIWLTGIEIKTANDNNLFSGITMKCGFFWEGPEKGKKPLKEYFEHFYQEKQAHKGKYSLYEHSKKMLNTLYGKFISTIPQKVQGKTTHFPGSIFNAPVGCLITAFSRCIIFESEIKYGSFHAATDSILCPGPSFPPDKLEKEVEMGDFCLEYQGDFVVGRNKLYAILEHEKTKGLFTGWDDEKRAWYYKGKKILKYALHAFQGNPVDFLFSVFDGKKEYQARRMGNIRESLRRPGIKPLTFNKIPMKVNFKGKYSQKEKNVSPVNGSTRKG